MKTRWMVGAAAVLLVGGLAGAAFAQSDAPNRRIRQALDEAVVSFSFEDQPLDQAVEFLGTLGNVNIVLDRAKVDVKKTITLKLKNVTLGTAVKLITEAAGVKYVIRDGVVFISDEEGTKELPVTRVFDVMDLVAEIPEFSGPEMDLSTMGSGNQTSGGSGGYGSGGGSGSSTSLWGTSSGTGGTGTTTQGAQQGTTLQERTDALVELIKSVIEPGTWDTGGY